jgi:hypothetical protein
MKEVVSKPADRSSNPLKPVQRKADASKPQNEIHSLKHDRFLISKFTEDKNVYKVMTKQAIKIIAFDRSSNFLAFSDQAIRCGFRPR